MPGFACAGLLLLLPPACPTSLEFTSLTAASGASTGFTCAVEAALARAHELSGGAPPARADLRAAVLEVAEHSLVEECTEQPRRFGARLSDVESIEITLLLILAESGELESLTVHPGPLYSTIDAWELAEPLLDRHTDTVVEAHHDRAAPDIFRLDRGRPDGEGVAVWAVASRRAACGAARIDASVLDGDTVVGSCALSDPSKGPCAGDADVVAGRFELDCDVPVRADESWLQWGSAPRVRIAERRDSTIRLVDPEGVWPEAVAMASRNSAFAAELEAMGLRLPISDTDAEVVLELDGQEVVVRREGAECGDAPQRSAAFALHGSPFSFAGVARANGRAWVTRTDDCVVVRMSPRSLSGDLDAGYEPAAFLATMRAVAWASSCITSGCDGVPSFDVDDEPAWPLLTPDQVAQAAGRGGLGQDALGVLLVALAFCMVVRSARVGGKE